MDVIRGPAKTRSDHTKGLPMALVVGVVVALATGSVAYGEPLVGTGQSAEGTYAAVATTGNASSSSGVAVSGGGYANGGTVGITGYGNSGGGIASVDADRTVGTANITAWQLAGQTGRVVHTGLNLVESAFQTTVIATAKPVDAAQMAVLLQDLAQNAPLVVQNVATGFLGTPSAPSGGASTMNHPKGGSVPIYFTVPGLWWGSQLGLPPDGCAPASAWNAYWQRGMPSKEQLYNEMGTSESGGTTLATAHAVIKNHYQGQYQPVLDRPVDAVDLLNKVTTATYSHRQGGMLAGQIAYLPWWNQDGLPTEGFHALAFEGYWHYYHGGGILTVDAAFTNGDQAAGAQLRIADAYAFVESHHPSAENIIW